MANWLVTVNYNEFDLEKAYEELPKIYWKNNVINSEKGFQINDIVYVYVTKPISQVIYQFKVIGYESAKNYPLIQKSFWNDSSLLNNIENYAIFEKLKKLNKATLKYDYFVQQKLIPHAPIQGRRTDRNKDKTDPIRIFLDHVSKEFHQDDINTDYPDEAYMHDKLLFEGAKQTVQVNRFERNIEARRQCIQVKGSRCDICNMSFEETYGAFAKGFIHVHHITPLHQISASYQVDPIHDLIPVCPNCHAMLHKTINDVPMTIDKLKLLFETSSNYKK